MLTGNELIQWLVWGWRIGYGWESSIPHPTALPLGHLSVFLAHSWLSLDWVIPGRRQGEGHQAFYHLITYCHLYNFLLIHWVQPTLRGWGIKCYFLKGEGPQETRVSGRQKDAETFNNNEPTESLWQRKSNLGNTEARCTESEPSAPRPEETRHPLQGAVGGQRVLQCCWRAGAVASYVFIRSP